MNLLDGVGADFVGGSALEGACVEALNVSQGEGGAVVRDLVLLGHLVVGLAPVQDRLGVAPGLALQGDGGALLDHDLAVAGLRLDGGRN